MADEQTQPVAPEAEQQPTNAAPTGDAPGQKAEETRTFTQADLDRIVTERLAKEKAKTEAAVKKAQEESERKAAEEQGKYQELYQRVQAELEAERLRAKSLELAGIRRDVAQRLNLPAGLIDRLRGEDEAAIEADAKALLAALPKPPAPDINAGNGAGNGSKVTVGLSDEELEHKAARLGVSLKYAKQFLNGGN